MTMSGSSSNSIRYSEGRFLVVEEEEVDQDLLCPSCHCLRENPKECTPCAHIFCAACITGADHCPECSQAIRGLKNPNRFLLHVTDQVHLQCAGCSWSGTVDASSSHRCEEQTKFVEAFKKTKKTPVGSKSTGKVKKAEETESELLRNYTNIDEEEGPYDLSDVPFLGAPPPPIVSPCPPAEGTRKSAIARPHLNASDYMVSASDFVVQSAQNASSDEFVFRPGAYATVKASDAPPPGDTTPWLEYGFEEEEYHLLYQLFCFYAVPEFGGDMADAPIDRISLFELIACLGVCHKYSEERFNHIFSEMIAIKQTQNNNNNNNSNNSGNEEQMNFGVFCHWVNNHRDQMKEKMFGLNFKEYIDAVLYFRTYDNTYENCIPREVFLELCVTPQEGKAMASTTTRALELLHDVLGEGGGDVTLDQYLRMIQYIRENNLQKYYNPNASTSDYCAFLGVPLGSPRHPARRPGRDNLSLPPLNNGRLSSPSSPFNYSTSNPNTTAPAGMAPLPPNVANNNNTNNGSGNNVMNMSGSGTLNTSFPSAGNTALPPLSARGHHTNHALTPKPEDLVYSGGRSTVNNNHNNSNIYGKATYVTAGRVRRTASADYDNESTSTSTETTTVGGGRKKKKEKECSVM